MVMSAMAWTPEEWAQVQFGRADLGDRRRTQRAVKLAGQMMRRPAASVPRQAGGWSDTKASYRLFDEQEVTFEALGREHWHATRQAARSRQVVLMVQDTTNLDYTDHPATLDLGPIGDGRGRGFLLHSTLAVDPHGVGEVLGLTNQMLFCRDGLQPEQTRTQRKQRDRESQIWGQSVAAVGASGSVSRWVHVCDRYADNFEMFDACRQSQVDLLIRLAQDRRCAAGHEASEPGEHLMQWVRTLPACGEKTLELRRRPKRSARQARLQLAYSAVTIFPPWLDRAKSEPWSGWVVRVWEPQTPAEEEPIEWVLLTSVPVLALEDALTIGHWYSLRWLIEEYHKALKTGCRVEERQMETQARLEACIGILSLVAVRLLQLKLWARHQPERPAAQCASPMHVQVLAAYWKKPVEAMTAREFWRDVARLGGFLARKRDGDPGWQTLWKGWQQLDAMTLGAVLMRNCG